MQDLKDNKLLWIVVIFTFMNLGFFFGSRFVINKTADKVIQKLQKEYSPSPYGPGIDPDKIDPEALKRQRVYFEMKKTLAQEPGHKAAWRDEWEKNRGFSPEQ
jgi:hypothetical protein